MEYLITTSEGTEKARISNFKNACMFSQYLIGMGVENSVSALEDDATTITVTKDEKSITDWNGASLTIYEYTTKDNEKRVSIGFDNQDPECRTWFEDKDAFVDLSLEELTAFIQLLK